MKACAKYLTIVFALYLIAPASFAQDDPPEIPAFSQQELEQMLAPIALYPDTLLSQILMAATYPLEVVEAARWSRANPGLRGEQAVRAADDRNWDPSVKSLVAFPQVLSMMDEKLDWTERLGDAFLAQHTQVMDTAQELRQRAYESGNLKSNDNYRVEQREKIIVVESPRPEVVYVPYYDPYVVYGGWRWASYPPVYWAPWPGYVYYNGFVGFRWSIGITVGPRFFFGACDWPRHHVTVVNVNTFYYPRVVQRTVVVKNNYWVHDPDHRRSVPYRNPEIRQHYARVNAPQVRREYPQYTQPSHEIRRDRNPQQVHNGGSTSINRRAQYPGDERVGRLDAVSRHALEQHRSTVKVADRANRSDSRNSSHMQPRTPLEPRATSEPQRSIPVESRTPLALRTPLEARAPTFQRPDGNQMNVQSSPQRFRDEPVQVGQPMLRRGW